MTAAGVFKVPRAVATTPPAPPFQALCPTAPLKKISAAINIRDEFGNKRGPCTAVITKRHRALFCCGVISRRYYAQAFS